MPEHPYLEEMEPLGWIHTQPNELPHLNPQVRERQGLLIKIIVIGRVDPREHHGGSEEVGGREDSGDDCLLHSWQLLSCCIQAHSCWISVSYDD